MPSRVISLSLALIVIAPACARPAPPDADAGADGDADGDTGGDADADEQDDADADEQDDADERDDADEQGDADEQDGADADLGCGDGACDADEDALSCPADCPARCGDHAVTHDEECDDALEPDPYECPTACGSVGEQRCEACRWTACEPPYERCNGLDDDCDGVVDDGFPCRPGERVACTTDEGRPGVLECDETCNFLPCACLADCAGRECGSDGCGGTCAPGCPDGDVCGRDGLCGGAPTTRIFVTSEVFSADLGGLPGADGHCQRLADAAGLAGTYRALLSDSATDAAARVTLPGPIFTTAGDLVAADLAALWSGGVAVPIDRDETGARVPASIVWTGTDPDGVSDRATTTWCNDWGSRGAPSGAVEAGRTDRSDEGWMAIYGVGGASGHACSNESRLYCFLAE